MTRLNIRKRTPHVTAFTAAALTACAITSAHEGMWTPSQLPQIAAALKSEGLELDPSTLTRLTDFPMGAIISLGGCTASFVSPQGLVVTNHHCAYGSLQYNSTPDKNLLRDGFLAKSLTDELPAAPGSRVYVTVDVRNVTDRVIDAKTAKLTGKKRIDAMETNQKSLVAACEQDPGHRCGVSSFYGGLEYQLIKQLEIRDVRIAYAPPEGVGKFGGDTDNWIWPRHTGDFSFYRAYVGKDGKPADYSRDNIPYKPAHHLKLARQGLNEGDFVMVLGYPGRTSRHRLPSEVQSTFDWSLPTGIRASAEQLDIITRETNNREAAHIAYVSTVAGIYNGYKKSQGLIDSYAHTDLLARKKSEYTALKSFLPSPGDGRGAGGEGNQDTQVADGEGNQGRASGGAGGEGDPGRASGRRAGGEGPEALLAERDAIGRREYLLGYATPRFLSTARTLYELAQQKAKPNDSARKPGYQQRDWPRIKESLESIDKRYDERVDRALVAHFLAQYLAQPAKDQNSTFLAALGVKPGMSSTAIDGALAHIYSASMLSDQRTRLAWLDRPIADFKSSTDSFIRAAVALYADDTRRDNRDKELNGKIQRAYSNYMQALIAYKQSKSEAVYPDANSTLRVTFGKVAGRPAGSVDGTAWAPFTTLNGILAKHTGAGEFNAPANQIAAIKEHRFGPYADPKLNSIPVNFLATLDITGGNSGSPVLNSRAELVGLAFDGTLDSVMSDWDFNPTTTRTIAVDLRYILWQMRLVDHADNLLRELDAP